MSNNLGQDLPTIIRRINMTTHKSHERNKVPSSSFPIPASLNDLERAPYNLLPYPEDFDDDDEAARADSFDALVKILENGNRTLMNGNINLFINIDDDDDDEDPWNDGERIQALYTLARKSLSLAPTTKSRFIDTLSKAIHGLCTILDNSGTADATEMSSQDSQLRGNNSNNHVVPQEFRDAFACHVYMLFSVMFTMESEAKVQNRRGKTSDLDSSHSEEITSMRSVCASAMLAAAKSMCQHRSKLWPRGVSDESIAFLPCRIAYLMLESATGVLARKAASADAALGMIAATVDSSENHLSTIVAALSDLLHSFEHIAPLVAELCQMVSEQPTNRLAVELLREIGRYGGGGETDNGRVSGIKHASAFISEIARIRPKLVFSNISLLLPHLNSEPYGLRSAIVAAIGHILAYIGKCDTTKNGDERNETQENQENPMQTNKSQNALLDILSERTHDVCSFTRAAVLKTWIRIVESDSLPLERIMPVTALAVDRLQDKSVLVRRSAMQLLTCLLENNPFLGYLDPLPYEKKLQEIYEVLKTKMPNRIREPYESAIEDARVSGDDDEIRDVERAALAAAINEGASMSDLESLTEEETEFRSNIQALKFTESALDFIGVFESANKAFNSMLSSANNSDVTEALRFFVKARHFKLPCAVTGMKQALAHMWSSEATIRDETLKAFVEVFIAVPGSDGKENLPEKQIAHTLLLLAGRASVSELASIEEALRRLVHQEKIPTDVFLVLWSIASKASGDARAAAMLVLSMAASADRSIVDSASRLRLLLEAGLGDYTQEHRDWRTAASAARALQRVGVEKHTASSGKHIVLEQIVDRLCGMIRGDWCIDSSRSDTLKWFSAAQKAISALFVVCQEPELECANIIRCMTRTTFGVENGQFAESCHPLRLARFFFVVGHIAFELLVYTEKINDSSRRANAKKSLKAQEIADQTKSKKRNQDKTCDGECVSEEAIESELGVAAAMEAEKEQKVADISDKEILGRGLINKFSPILIRVVGNAGGRYNCVILRQSATLALCKFMCISSSFCEDNLPLLFTVLADSSQDITLRANTAVALGDIAFRFPNELEPYTARLYACLRDSSDKVRRHTLMVLTHLILNDMVKVKGQVCEIAACLEDDDHRIRDMARLLFHELSKRSNNPIYNLLPDIISQLSQQSMKTGDFRSIMSFLLSSIKKERQCETLVDKFCKRFPNCTSTSQAADLAFCLCQLKINERAVKILSDNFKLYKDALVDDDVKKSFFSILTRMKKFAKPELKEILDDWEVKMSEHAKLGEENMAADQQASKAKVKHSQRQAKRTKKAVSGVCEAGESESDACDIDKENGSPENPRRPSKPNPKSSTKKLRNARTPSTRRRGRRLNNPEE